MAQECLLRALQALSPRKATLSRRRENIMTNVSAKLKNLLFTGLGFFAALGVLSLTRANPAQAQSPGVNVATLVAQISALQTQVAALQAKTAPLSLSGTTLTITGVNVQIVSGSGSTSDGTADVFGSPTGHGALTGLGNLILGYNASRSVSGAPDIHTGSHNLILGDQNNYSSFGGLVVGNVNTISAAYATVPGGQLNTASGFASSVSGGAGNVASGYLAAVAGGGDNTASGTGAVVGGGSANKANGDLSTVTGGQFNVTTTDAPYASVSGGHGVKEPNGDGWAAGGRYFSPDGPGIYEAH